jgi:hypothetical protein
MSVHCDGKLNSELDKYEMTKHLNKHSLQILVMWYDLEAGKSSLTMGIF